MLPRQSLFAALLLLACSSAQSDADAGVVPACLELDIDPQSCAPLFPATYDRIYEEVLAGEDGQSGCAAGGSACHAEAGAGAAGGVVFGADREAVYDTVLAFVEPGDPACGPFSVRIHTDDPSIRMPPGNTGLDERARCAIAQWVESGADR